MSVNESPTYSDIQSLFETMDSGNRIEQRNVLEKLQAIRLWQLKQQEELKKQQTAQLELLKSQSISKPCHSNSTEEKDEILAIPISSSPTHLDTILEQSSLLENRSGDGESGKATNSEKAIETPDDSILEQLHDNIETLDNSSPLKENEEEVNLENDDLKEQNAFSCESPEDLHSDIESSFENVSSQKVVAFDDVPVKAGKTFEEILSEQLFQEKSDNTSNKKASSASTPKRPFLRKGQGIARFNGPPKKTKVKKKVNIQKTQGPSNFEVKIFEPASKSKVGEIPIHRDVNSNDSSTEISSTSSAETKPKQCVRKTARITKKEPMKHLVLNPDVGKSLPATEKLPALQKLDKSESHNDSVWSDGEDTVLALDASDVNAYNTTSNETFEQMEKFCNEHYADVSTVNTLEDEDSVIMKKIEPLPPNKLMLRLFPSLQNNSKSNNTQKLLQKHASADSNSNTGVQKSTAAFGKVDFAAGVKDTCDSTDAMPVEESKQSSVLKSKLEEMEAEIKHFQMESVKLSTVRKQEESQLKLLKQEFEEFQRQKEDELNRLNEFKKTEFKKLKKDRKLFEDHVAATKSLPNKRDREYIQELENKISDLQNEFKLKEQRLNAVNNRLRSQLETVMEEKENLKEKVKKLEESNSKLEHEKELRKNKRSQVAWKAINEIVDSIPVNNENSNFDQHVQSNLKPRDAGTKPSVNSLPMRNPLRDVNENSHLNTSEVMVHEGKTEKRNKDGSVEVVFQNGTKKFVFPDGSTQIKFINGDVKTIYADGIVKYHYISTGTWHTTHPNGMQVIEFSNKQVERHFPDGSKHISFEDGSSKMIKLNGSEETIFPDGTVMTVSTDGEKTIEFSNGQREIHNAGFKRREYPDGTCKTVFSDGRQETKYSSGRLRIKDANGILIVDKMLS